MKFELDWSEIVDLFYLIRIVIIFAHVTHDCCYSFHSDVIRRNFLASLSAVVMFLRLPPFHR